MASLRRREMLAGAAASVLAGCGPASPMTAAHTPRLDMKRLNRAVADIARGLAPGVLGAGLMNLDSGEVFAFNGERRFPMQSVFKAPLAAAALAEVDAGRLDLAERTVLKAMDLSAPHSPIAEAWPQRTAYSWDELLRASLLDSDNTAADVLMARIGGPGAITAWLNAKDIYEIRIDRYEREIQTGMLGMAPFRPEWRGRAAFARARATVPPAQTRAALMAYLHDPRDTATPRGALHFLHLLQDGDLVGPASRRRLLQMMRQASPGIRRLAAGLPRGSTFAHKPGTGPVAQGIASAVNDIGLATLPDGRLYAMAAFVSGTTATPRACDAALAELGRAFVRGAR